MLTSYVEWVVSFINKHMLQIKSEIKIWDWQYKLTIPRPLFDGHETRQNQCTCWDIGNLMRVVYYIVSPYR